MFTNIQNIFKPFLIYKSLSNDNNQVENIKFLVLNVFTNFT